MQVAVLDINGKEKGSIDLNESVFGVEPNEHVVHLSVKAHLAAKRQGTHKSKERNEIVGSTKKIKKQKGTGTARAGSIKSGVFVGGGRMFGPRPRKYNLTLNKKVKTLARISALSSKVASDELLVVQDFSFEAPKTKEYLSFLGNIDKNGTKTLFVATDANDNVYRSARNIPKASVVSVENVSTYDIINNDCLILSESAAKKLNELA